MYIDVRLFLNDAFGLLVDRGACSNFNVAV